jgi:AAA domain
MQVRTALPCSVQLPAGTGKTQIIAAVGTLAADAGERALVLTHTNAGVDALRRRLRLFGTSAGQVRVETIASWAHSLVRHYPQLAEVQVPEIPRGSDSETYYKGALLVASSTAIRSVLRAS